MPDTSIAVIGAGIVGASVALALQRDGNRVTLLERKEPCAGASFGNAGAIVNACCIPTAMPGAAINALRMLSNPKSPLSIKPAYFHSILPWLMRFVYESRSSRVNKNARDLYAITHRANAAWRRLTNDTDLSRLLHQRGWLKVYGSERSFASTKEARALMDEIGTPYDVLNAADIEDIEPQLAPIYQRGLLQGDSLHIHNPQRMVEGMVDLLVSRGGSFASFNVRAISIDGDSVCLQDSENVLSFQKVVIAAGAWSGALAKQLGDKLPLEAERGYHLMLPRSNNNLLSRSVVNADRGFVLVPMETGLRLTSQVEFASLDAPPDYRHIRGLLPAASRMLPGLDASEESVWMGPRPSLPDSLPVLGFAARSENVLYAFGHQHLGMTLGPLTGQIIADLVANRDPGIDLKPYSPRRY